VVPPADFRWHYQPARLGPLPATAPAHGAFAPEGLCCPFPPRSYAPIRHSRQLPLPSQVRWLYRRSAPDDLVWAAAETFPTLGQRSVHACHPLCAGRRNRVQIPDKTPLPWPSSLLNGVGSSPIPASASAGFSSRRVKQWFASLRPACSLALLDRSDLESPRSPAAEDVLPELAPRKVTLPESRVLLHGARGGRRDWTFTGWSTAVVGCTQQI
jgi:hypothetical protein